MLQANLHGPSSVKNPNAKSKGGVQPAAVCWGVNSITPGAIALATVVVSDTLPCKQMHILNHSVQAIYIVSPDTEFSDVSDISGIPYCRCFNTYKSCLLEKIKKNSPQVKLIFSWYNSRLFGDAKSIAWGPEPVNADDSDVEKAQIEQAFARLDVAQGKKPVCAGKV